MFIAEKVISERTPCFHCGEDCDDGIIMSSDKPFCCTGCQLVYELLQEHGLSSYYDIQGTPGIRQTEVNEFNYLDNEAIRGRILEFQSDTLERVTFNIPVIHCSACVYLLEHLYKIQEAVIRSEVNFVRKEVSIDYVPQHMKLSELAHLLQRLGYTPRVNLEKKSADRQARMGRDLALRIGVAGFCFGNIMLLSFPEYLGLEAINESAFKRFFSWISFVLSLPVFFFSGWGYLKSAFLSLRQKYLNLDVPIAMGMITLLSRSLFEVYTASGSGYSDSLAGLIFFLLLGKWFQNRTYQFLSFERDYKSYFPLAVQVIEGEHTVSTSLDELKVGQTILLRNNDIIPADGELLSESAQIDYSFVTGESQLITKQQQEVLYAGGRISGASVKLITTKEVSRSYLTRLWNHKDFRKSDEQFKGLADKISKHFTLTILFIALMAAGYWAWVKPDEVWGVFTAVLIVACPCALALAAPFTLGSSMRVMGRNQLYLKNAAIIEKMAEVDTIIFDKTGTLTLPQKEDIRFEGSCTAQELKGVAALVSQSSHPISRKILQSIGPANGLSVDDFQEFPGKGISAVVNGSKIQLGSGKLVEGVGNMSGNTNRTFLSIDDEVRGHFEISTSYRAGLQGLIARLKDQFHLHLLTGDHSEEEKNRFTQDFRNDLTLTFDQGPEAKMAYINQLQKQGDTVAMIGDGLNDSGALNNSNVGLAVTEDTSLFTPASDGIIQGKSLTHLPEFFALAQRSKRIVIASFGLSFLYNALGISFAVTANLTPLTAAILMPLSSITVVLFSTMAINLAGRQLKLI